MIPAQKKEDKQNLENYRSISLLPVTGKIFVRILNIVRFMISLQKIT